MSGLGNLPADYTNDVIRKLENDINQLKYEKRTLQVSTNKLKDEVKQLKDEKQMWQVSTDKLKHELSSISTQLNTTNEQLNQATATYQELENYINFLLKERHKQKKISKLQLELCQEKSTIIHSCEEFIEEANRKSTKRKADAPINLD